MDVIQKHGAMNQLISGNAQAQVSKKVADILCHLFINDWQSEPKYQHHNPAERCYKTVKFNVNWVLNMTGAPAFCWLLCLYYVTFIMNRLALESLEWRMAFECLKGSTPDISMIYPFRFYDSIYYKRNESEGGKEFPSSSDELPGRFVSFSENVEHQMTYKILTDDTLKVIHRSRIKLAGLNPNLRRDEPTGRGTRPDPDIQPTEHHPGGNHVDDITPDEDIIRGRPGEHTSMAIIDANDIIDRSYLQKPEEDGTRHRLRIIAKLDEHDANIANDPTMIRFLLHCE
jgi:hypothetical protein